MTTHERVLLQTIKFDLQVEHPYARLLKFAKQLNGQCIIALESVERFVYIYTRKNHTTILTLYTGEKAKIEKLVQMAWTFVNDRYVCTVITRVCHGNEANLSPPVPSVLSVCAPAYVCSGSLRRSP